MTSEKRVSSSKSSKGEIDCEWEIGTSSRNSMIRKNSKRNFSEVGIFSKTRDIATKFKMLETSPLGCKC